MKSALVSQPQRCCRQPACASRGAACSCTSPLFNSRQPQMYLHHSTLLPLPASELTLSEAPHLGGHQDVQRVRLLRRGVELHQVPASCTRLHRLPLVSDPCPSLMTRSSCRSNQCTHHQVDLGTIHNGFFARASRSLCVPICTLLFAWCEAKKSAVSSSPNQSAIRWRWEPLLLGSALPPLIMKEP